MKRNPETISNKMDISRSDLRKQYILTRSPTAPSRPGVPSLPAGP